MLCNITGELALELLKHRLGDHSGVHNHVYSEPGQDDLLRDEDRGGGSLKLANGSAPF
jgi:hypothetical protein